MKQLSGQDATFLYLESPGVHLHLTALYVYQQPKSRQQRLGFTQVVQHIASRLERIPLLRQKLERPPLDLDYPYWVDDPEFDLREHVLLHEGAAPRNRRQLFDTLASIHSTPLDLSRPPWEMHVFEKLGPIEGLPANSLGIIAKYHHAAIDGASGALLLDGLHDSSPVPNDDVPDKRGEDGRTPGLIEMLVRATINNVGTTIKLGKALGAALPGTARSVIGNRDAIHRRSACVPATRFNAAVSSRRVFHAMSFKLRQIKGIRKAVPGATVNDVILAICGGGLRLWLEAMDELPNESLVAMVPVNARTSEEQSLGGNRLSTLFMPVHTNIPGPLDRLRAIYQATRKAKSAEHGVSAQQLSEISSRIPALPLSAAGRLITGLGLGYRLIHLCNCTITNVPGPRTTLYLGPARLVYNTGSAPILDGMGLIICVFSYRDEVSLSFTSCPDMLPDPEFLAQCTQEAFQHLLQETRGVKPSG